MKKDPTQAAFGAAFQEYRREMGFSGQNGLARAAGLSTDAIRFIEQGRTRPRGATLEKLARALDVTPVALEAEVWNRARRSQVKVLEGGKGKPKRKPRTVRRTQTSQLKAASDDLPFHVPAASALATKHPISASPLVAAQASV